ncbi:thiol:disulfide interchange protein DsbD [Rhodobacter sp. 24-YEA-8]|nr:thiol:disulfide interchange protein DsbD [Rhodobacter sp. 24-YEA-8]
MMQSLNSSPRIIRLLVLIPLLWLFVAGSVLAQQFSFPTRSTQPLDPEIAFRIELLDSAEGRSEIGWQIEEGYYLYREHIKAETVDGTALDIETHAGKLKEDPNFGAVEVYYNATTAVLPQAGGEVRITWQGCQEDGICYAPVTSTLMLADWSGATPPAESAVPAAPAGGSGLHLVEDKGLLASLAGQGGAALVLLAFFGFGLMLALTPCVFPMVPILAGMLARQGETLTPARGAALSGAYVLAMATAFALLGAVAGWSGQNLQILLQSPWAIGAVVALFLALALSSFGLFDLRLPAGLTARLSGGAGRRGSLGGAAALGFTSALIVGPCVTAPLAGAFIYIAQTGDVTLGAAALFMLGLGQGVPLFLAGTFGAKILPKAGVWMEAMRRIFGVVFLGMAIWLLERLMPGPAILLLWAVLLAGVAVSLGVLDRQEPGAAPENRLLRTGGVVALFAAAVLGLGAALGGTDPLRPLAPLSVATGSARAAGPDLTFAEVTTTAGLSQTLAAADRPAMIYLTADWCVTCKRIERSVMPDPGVTTALGNFLLVKADVSETGADARELMQMIEAAGPPTMIFLDRHNREAADSRLIGTIGAEDIRTSAALVQAAD